MLFQTDPEDFLRSVFSFPPLNIQDDLSFHHHDETVSVIDGILHIVSDHHCGEMITVDDHVSDLQDFCCCFGIKSSSMFIQKQKLRLSRVAIRSVRGSCLCPPERSPTLEVRRFSSPRSRTFSSSLYSSCSSTSNTLKERSLLPRRFARARFYTHSGAVSQSWIQHGQDMPLFYVRKVW